MPFRIRLFAAHLAIGGLVIVACVGLIALIWYPPPLVQLEGVLPVLLMIAGVDLGVGPLSTLIVASPTKPPRELRRDLAVIVAIQLVAMGYGIYSTFAARPVFLVYNAGEFDIARANDLNPAEIAKARDPRFSLLSWTGPVVVAAKLPDDPKEAMTIVNAAIKGGDDVQDLPRLYRPWPAPELDVLQRGKSVGELPTKAERSAVRALIQEHGIAEADVVTIPILGKTHSGTVVIRRTDQSIVGIVLSA